MMSGGKLLIRLGFGDWNAPADRVHWQLGGGGIRPISRAGGIHYQGRTTLKVVEDFSGGHDHFEGEGRGKERCIHPTV